MIKCFQKNVKRTLIILFALYLVVSAPVSVFADVDMHSYIPPAGNISSVQDKLMAEAHAQLAMYVLTACVGGGINKNEKWEKVKDHTTWFDRAGNDMTIDVGYWYEKKMTGSKDDGRIKCSESGTSPVKIAATSIDKKEIELFCDGDSAGIAKNKDGYVCGGSDGKYLRNSSNNDSANRGDGTFGGAAWSNHLQKLFDEKAEAEKWEHSYVDVNHFYEMVGYYLYREEIKAKCGGSSEEYGSKPSNMDMVLIDVTQDGERAGKIVYRRYKQNETFKHEFVSRMSGKSCQDMISRANEEDLYGKYRDRMIATLNWECKDNIDERKNKVEQAGHEINTETLAAYNAAVSNTANYNIGQFVTGNETDGWRCADIGDFEGATMEEPDPTADLDQPVSESEPSCYDSAGSMGWILCPIINKGQQTVEWLYGFIEGFLQINTNLFATNGKASGTYAAWSTFQSIANVAFVILFLVVIFSQLTGYGIDNYGIKKILPKLIVTALLINMSYIICQLAIDIANIVGHGIESLFTTIQNNILRNNVAAIKLEGDLTSHNIKAGLAGGVIITIVGGICVGAVLATNGAIIVPVLITILTILISIVALLIILAVRQAMAVLLVVISPCAFMCYMLPNTKSLFDKWKKALSGLLLAYPICSAIIYGGEMISTILLVANNNGGSGTSNFAVALSAAIISIAPIFLIPGIIKGSMGKISGTISNMGKGIGGHLGRRVRESNFAHDMKRREMLGKAGIKLGKDGQIKETLRGRMQRPRTKAGQQRLNARRMEAVKEINAMNNNTSYTGTEGIARLQKNRNAFLAGQKNQEVKDLESSILAGHEKTSSGNVVSASDNASLQSALSDALLSGDENSIRAYQNILTSKGDAGREAVRSAMVDAMSRGTVSDDAKRYYSQNIMDYHSSDYKNNNRSVYDFAKVGQSHPSGALSMSDTIDSGTLKGSQMSDMDDDAFARLETQYFAGSSTGVDQNIYGAAVAALNSEQAGNMKQERRRKLENIINNYSGTPIAPTPTPTPTPTPAPTPAPTPDPGSGPTPTPAPTPAPTPDPGSGPTPTPTPTPDPGSGPTPTPTPTPDPGSGPTPTA